MSGGEKLFSINIHVDTIFCSCECDYRQSSLSPLPPSVRQSLLNDVSQVHCNLLHVQLLSSLPGINYVLLTWQLFCECRMYCLLILCLFFKPSVRSFDSLSYNLSCPSTAYASAISTSASCGLKLRRIIVTARFLCSFTPFNTSELSKRRILSPCCLPLDHFQQM